MGCTVLESNPKKQEDHGQKRTWSNSGEKWPGEAHKQPPLATQYYLRARSEGCLRIATPWYSVAVVQFP